MNKFGIRLMFIIDAENQQDAAKQISEFVSAGVEGSGVEVDAAVIAVDALPVEMGGTGEQEKPRFTAEEQTRREMIRNSCDRRMN